VTPLRQHTLNELQRSNYAPSTIRSYLGAVEQFAEYFHRSPRAVRSGASASLSALSATGEEA
jgi:hypothetical protein